MKELTAAQAADLLMKCKKVAESVRTPDQVITADRFFRLAFKQFKHSNEHFRDDLFSSYIQAHELKSEFKYCWKEKKCKLVKDRTMSIHYVRLLRSTFNKLMSTKKGR